MSDINKDTNWVLVYKTGRLVITGDVIALYAALRGVFWASKQEPESVWFTNDRYETTQEFKPDYRWINNA